MRQKIAEWLGPPLRYILWLHEEVCLNVCFIQIFIENFQGKYLKYSQSIPLIKITKNTYNTEKLRRSFEVQQDLIRRQYSRSIPNIIGVAVHATIWHRKKRVHFMTTLLYLISRSIGVVLYVISAYSDSAACLLVARLQDLLIAKEKFDCRGPSTIY